MLFTLRVPAINALVFVANVKFVKKKLTNVVKKRKKPNTPNKEYAAKHIINYIKIIIGSETKCLNVHIVNKNVR